MIKDYKNDLSIFTVNEKTEVIKHSMQSTGTDGTLYI